MLKQVIENFETAAAKGVSSAYFYLGMIYHEGIFVDQDIDKAVDCYVRGAAKNNAVCFYALS